MRTTSNGFLSRKSPPHIVTLIILSGISALGMNIFLPSLPGMAEYYRADYSLLQLSVAIYLGMNAVVQTLIGPVADMMGRRPVILGGLFFFLLATLGCIYAPTAEIFLLFRMCQAVVAVTMVLSRAAVRDMYAADRAASMIGYVTMGVAIVPMIGPAIGGGLDQAFGWKANFWLLFLLGALCLALTWFDFGETAHKSGKTLIAQFREYPELFCSPRFWGYSLSTALSSGAFFAYLGGAPYVGTEIYGLDPAKLGLFFGAPAAGYFVGNFISGRYSMRYGINRMILWGCWLNGFGLAVSVIISLSGLGTVYTFFGLMTFVGLGNGMAIPNATSGALSVRPKLAGTASGLSGAIMLGGGAALSGLAGYLLTPGSGEFPLLALMLTTASGAIVAITLVIRREARLGL